MYRRWFTRIALFSVLHYLVLVLFDSFIYLLVHIPTPVVKIDPLIIGFTYLQQVLTLPRWLLRHLWLGESTPTLLNWALAIINSLLWGLLFTWLTRRRWQNPWDSAV